LSKFASGASVRWRGSGLLSIRRGKGEAPTEGRGSMARPGRGQRTGRYRDGFSPLVVIAAMLAYIALLFVLAQLGERTERGRKLASQTPSARV
jgi:hypothetical protein